MPTIDMLVDVASCYELLSFMEGHDGNNHIVIEKKDVTKQHSDVHVLLELMNGW